MPPRGHLRLIKSKTEGHDKKKKAPMREWTVSPEYVQAAINMEAPDDSEEFPGEKIVIEASLNGVLLAQDDYVEGWLHEQHTKEGGGALAAPPRRGGGASGGRAASSLSHFTSTTHERDSPRIFLCRS